MYFKNLYFYSIFGLFLAFFRQGSIAKCNLKLLENLILTKVKVSQMIASLVTFHYQERESLSSGEHLGALAECEPGGGAEDRGQGDRGGEGGGGHRRS